jgi:hypothetical protein
MAPDISEVDADRHGRPGFFMGTVSSFQDLLIHFCLPMCSSSSGRITGFPAKWLPKLWFRLQVSDMPTLRPSINF